MRVSTCPPVSPKRLPAEERLVPGSPAPLFLYTALDVRSYQRRLFVGNFERAFHDLADLSAFPLCLHDSRGAVTVGSKRQMSNFVGDNTPQNQWCFELGIMGFCEAKSRFVIHAGEDRCNCKAKDA